MLTVWVVFYNINNNSTQILSPKTDLKKISRLEIKNNFKRKSIRLHINLLNFVQKWLNFIICPFAIFFNLVLNMRLLNLLSF